MKNKRNDGIGARFREWAMSQADVATMTNSAAEGRYHKDNGERPSTATCGQIMADLRRELRAKANGKHEPQLDFTRLGMPQMEPFVEAGKGGVITNVAPAETKPNIFVDMKVVMEAAKAVGGYDRLVELARGLKEAGF